MAENQLPPLEVVGADGVRTTVSGLTHASTLRDLADALGEPGLTVEGGTVEPARPLVRVPQLCRGVRLHPLDDDRRAGSGPRRGGAATDVDGPVELAVVTGPSCAPWRTLSAGRHVLGRSPDVHVHVADASIERHHVLLDVDPAGPIRFTQICGSVPARLDRRPVDAGADVPLGRPIVLGATSIVFRRRSHALADPRSGTAGGSIDRHVTDPWRRVVRRGPVRRETWDPDEVRAPVATAEASRPAATALVGAAVAAIGAVVIAMVMDNPLFLVFAGVGALAAVATWFVGAGAARRRRRRSRAEYDEAVERFTTALDALAFRRRAHHRAMCPEVESIVGTALDPAGASGDVWATRSPYGVAATSDGSAAADGSRSPLVGAIGRGTARWDPPVAWNETATSQRREADHRLRAIVDRVGLLDEMSAPMSIGDGDAVALCGPGDLAPSVARAYVTQLAWSIGPADWRLVVVSDRHDLWAWTDWLPHLVLRTGGSAGTERLADELEAVDGRQRLVLVTDEPALFAARTGPLRRFLTRTGAASLIVADGPANVPAISRRVLTIGLTGAATWSGEVPVDDAADDIVVAGITVATADSVARRLACLVDPEADDAPDAGVPASLRFGELTAGPSTADGIVERWWSGGPDPAPRTALGRSGDGVVDVDLVRDGPHGLIAGTTGSGKSELLRSLVLGLCADVSPEHLNVVLVDYKGGSTFDACARLPHTVGLVTDLDDGLAERALISLAAELHRRERLLREVGATDLTDYRTRRDVAPIARLVVVIDEFAALAAELPDFLTALVGIAQRGRSLGVHLLLATQRPAGVVNDQIRANTDLRLALRLHDRADAVDVVGDPLPAEFPRSVPGRAAMRLGPDELVVFQSAWCTGPAMRERRRPITVVRHVPDSAGDTGPDAGPIRSDVGRPTPTRPLGATEPESAEPGMPGSAGAAPTELVAVVDAIVEAARRCDLPPAHRPWLAPLPSRLTAEPDEGQGRHRADGDTDGGGGTGIGLVDDPGHQRRLPLCWTPEHGSLAVVGSIGSGTTSTLIALAAATCRTRSPRDVHLYVVDARGDDGLGALGAIAHCGGVVRLVETERLHRLLDRLAGIVAARLSGIEHADAASEVDVVLMVDGWTTLRTALSSVDRTATNELLQRVTADGPAVGVVTVLTDAGASPSASSIPVAERWVFHLDDPSSGRYHGLRCPPPPAVPGRLRIASSGLEAQVAVGAAGLAAIPGRSDDPTGPSPIATLPEVVASRMLGPVTVARPDGDERVRLEVGIGDTDLRTDGLAVQIGDPVLVVGGPRTGVSTAVERCLAAWHAAVDGLDVVRLGRRRPLDAELADRLATAVVDTVLVVDDAHRVDDHDGFLTAVARGDHPRVRLIAGARADAVRTSYGHWTREAAKARCGVVMSSRGDPDGDVLGVAIPRRPLVAARPGLAWLVDTGPLRQVQIADVESGTSSSETTTST